MKRMWQSDWFGIKFTDLTRPNPLVRANSNFYDKLYTRLFDIYDNYDQLPDNWKQEKKKSAQWIRLKLDTGSSILSVGCGIGAIEKALIDLGISPNRITVTDTSEKSLSWIRDELPYQHTLVGEIPACIPEGKTYDAVILSAVEYALNNAQLLGLLASINDLLNVNGKLLLISASVMNDHLSMFSIIKSYLYLLFHSIAKKEMPQFWGFERRPDEIISLLVTSGYEVTCSERISTASSQWGFVAQKNV